MTFFPGDKGLLPGMSQDFLLGFLQSSSEISLDFLQGFLLAFSRDASDLIPGFF